MAIIQTVRDALLDMVGFESVAEAGPGVAARVLQEINRAAEIIANDGPDEWTKRPSGWLMRAPTSLNNLTFTEGSTTVTGAGLTNWMNACTVQLSGQVFQNQLQQSGSDWSLLLPWDQATTSTGSMIVYNDAIELPARVFKVLEPMDIPTVRRVVPLTNDSDLYKVGGYNNDSDYGANTYGVPMIRNRDVGEPWGYRVQAQIDSTGFPKLYLRLHPLPQQQYMLRGWVKMLWPAITSLDATTAQICPNGMDSSIFTPIARWCFSSCELYSGNKQDLEADLMEAKRMLEAIKMPQTGQMQSMSNGGVY